MLFEVRKLVHDVKHYGRITTERNRKSKATAMFGNRPSFIEIAARFHPSLSSADLIPCGVPKTSPSQRLKFLSFKI
jgi:hypothetical protein